MRSFYVDSDSSWIYPWEQFKIKLGFRSNQEARRWLEELAERRRWWDTRLDFIYVGKYFFPSPAATSAKSFLTSAHHWRPAAGVSFGCCHGSNLAGVSCFCCIYWQVLQPREFAAVVLSPYSIFVGVAQEQSYRSWMNWPNATRDRLND